jgi:hypothetical protein
MDGRKGSHLLYVFEHQNSWFGKFWCIFVQILVSWRHKIRQPHFYWPSAWSQLIRFLAKVSEKQSTNWRMNNGVALSVITAEKNGKLFVQIHSKNKFRVWPKVQYPEKSNLIWQEYKLISLGFDVTRLANFDHPSFGSMATRLGEFEPIRWLFTLGSFIKIIEGGHVFEQFLHA